MTKQKPHFWVLHTYHLFILLTVYFSREFISENGTALVKAIIVVGGCIAISYFLATSGKVPIGLAIITYLALAIVYIEQEGGWFIGNGINEYQGEDTLEPGGMFMNFQSKFLVGDFSQAEDFTIIVKAVDLIPLAMLSLVLSGRKQSESVDNPEVLDT